MKKYLLIFLVLAAVILYASYSRFVNSPSLPATKNYRYLLMISSFKRPMFLSGQIFRLMNQTYQNFDISVSIKGVDREKSLQTFEKEWKKLKEEKRLFVRYDPNRAQLSNLLDTVRDIDVTKYDYFCKIDDDDWYAPEYLENVNDGFNAHSNVDLSYSENSLSLYENIDTTIIKKLPSYAFGPTICFSRRVLEMLLALEKHFDLYSIYLPNEPEGLEKIREDRLYHHLAGYWFETQERKSDEPLVIYGLQYPSVTRNKNYIR